MTYANKICAVFIAIQSERLHNAARSRRNVVQKEDRVGTRQRDGRPAIRAPPVRCVAYVNAICACVRLGRVDIVDVGAGGVRGAARGIGANVGS